MKPILFRSCRGNIVYIDGTIEPISSCREFQGQCEVRAASGRYIYVLQTRQHESGLILPDYYFAKFNHIKQDYDIIVENIKEFQILGVDLAE